MLVAANAAWLHLIHLEWVYGMRVHVCMYVCAVRVTTRRCTEKGSHTERDNVKRSKVKNPNLRKKQQTPSVAYSSCLDRTLPFSGITCSSHMCVFVDVGARIKSVSLLFHSTAGNPNISFSLQAYLRVSVCVCARMYVRILIHDDDAPCLARCASLFDVVPATTSASGGRPHTTKCSKKRGGSSTSALLSASLPDVPAPPFSRFSADCCCFCCCCCCFIHSRFSLHSNSMALSTAVKLTFRSRSATSAKASTALTGADARRFRDDPGGMVVAHPLHPLSLVPFVSARPPLYRLDTPWCVPRLAFVLSHTMDDA